MAIRRLGRGQSAQPLSLSRDGWRVLVIAQGDELPMPEVMVAGPLEELEVTDENWLQPAAIGHLARCEARAPTTALLLR